MGIIDNFISRPEGRIIISIIWGFGLAALFRKVCKGRDCIVIEGPKPTELENKVYGFNNKCYTYKAETTSCRM